MGLYKSKNITSARRTADLWFGRYIRLRDMDKDTKLISCITCGKQEPFGGRKMDCGHWIEASVDATRYNEWNAHGQCKACNLSDNGLAAFHGKQIQLLHGEDVYEELLELAQEDVTLSIEQTMEQGRKYKELAKELAKQKGIEL